MTDRNLNDKKPSQTPLDAVQLRTIDAIVNGMLDAQAEGELHRLEQLRNLSLHAGPAFDEAVQARFALQEQMLQHMYVESAVDVSAKVMTRVRTERATAATNPSVAKELRAATLHRLHERNERVREGAEPVGQAFAGPLFSRSAKESQGGRLALPVHHRRRLVSSTALAFFAGGLVTLALVAVQLMRTPTAHTHIGDSFTHTHVPTELPLALHELEHRAYFDPSDLPMIEEVPSASVLRLGNGNQFDRDNGLSMASASGSPSMLDLQAQLRQPLSAPLATNQQDTNLATDQRIRDPQLSQPSDPTDPRDILATLQLTPQQKRNAIDLLSWGLKPWELPVASEAVKK